MKREALLAALEDGGLSERLKTVYGEDAGAAAGRLKELVEEFGETFPWGEDDDIWLFSTPGRTELGGNHTDHQHGRCLAASVDLDTIACVVPRPGRGIRVKSRHHRMAELDAGDLTIHPEEAGNSVSLVRGIAARLAQMNYTVGGFDAYTTTRVLRGSGLSSSAAFEVLVGTIMNHLFCAGELTPLQVSRIGQYAENVYYNKPCGLMDQLACATGGVVSIDFHDPDSPQMRRVPMDLTSNGYALCIVDSRASHADLTADYAAIPQEMRQVAACFDREVLGDLPQEVARKNLSLVRATCGDRAVLRAYHFFREDARVLRETEALEKGDFEGFLECVRQSGHSSFMYLQNVSNYRESRSQPVALLLAVAEDLLNGQGAVRVHGGGFAGTIQAYVPLAKLEGFVEEMESIAGQGACYTVAIRPCGSVLLAH